MSSLDLPIMCFVSINVWFYVRHGCGSHCLVHSLLASSKGVFSLPAVLVYVAQKTNGWYKEIHIQNERNIVFTQPPGVWVPVFVFKGCKVFYM